MLQTNRRGKLSLLILLLFSVQISFSQNVEKSKNGEISDELKKEATAFLRETANDVNTLRTLENRISFSSELAGLMWFSNEKEARVMFQSVINDFRLLLSNYDAQLNANEAQPPNAEEYSLLTGGGNRTGKKFAQAIAVRQQIAKAIAEHDPQLALEFFNDTGAAITNAAFRKQIESGDAYFETRLLNQIADRDVNVALKYGRKTLAKGFNYETISLLKKIYDKDSEKGAAFGEEIVSKLKSDASKPDSFYFLTQVFDTGLDNSEAIKGKSDKRPMFSEQALRDLGEIIAQELLKRGELEGYQINSYLSNIEKVLPARALEIRRKFDIKQNTKTGVATKINSAAVPPPPPPPAPKPPGDVESSSNNQDQLAENMKNLGTKKLSDEERRKIIGQSRKIIAESPNREQRLLGLSALAVQTAKLGDQELALEIMGEVQSAINLQSKNYREFIEIWLFAGNYAQVDASKAFPILENAIFRLNETISAVIKVGEFIDANNELIDEGEVQVGGFGNEIVGSLLRNTGATDFTIRNLAVADFAKTKDLTNKFDRTEVRILAKMLVLRSVFTAVSKPNQENSTGK